MADHDLSRPDLLARAAATRAHSLTLRQQVAELAEAVAQVELDVARVHEDIAEQGGSLAAQAREHAQGAREFAATEHAQAQRLRTAQHLNAYGDRGCPVAAVLDSTPGR